MSGKAATRQRGKRKRRHRIEEAVQYALAHQIRLEILILLNEASYIAAEIAELLDRPLSTVANHLTRMADDGSIEVVDTEQRRGTNVHWYRAVALPEYSEEEAEALTEMERQVTAGLVVQSGSAEVMAALWKGHRADPRTILSWDWYSVDAEGRDAMEAENVRHLERLREIEIAALNRSADSGEETTPILVSLFAFVRARKPRRPSSRVSDPNQLSD